jgi:hypothetical protein
MPAIGELTIGVLGSRAAAHRGRSHLHHLWLFPAIDNLLAAHQGLTAVEAVRALAQEGQVSGAWTETTVKHLAQAYRAERGLIRRRKQM